MGLPSGQDVARAMGVPVIGDDQLKVGKATEDTQSTNPRLVDLKDVGNEFVGKAPVVVLRSRRSATTIQEERDAIRLGPVGGRIVAETFIGLLLADRHSFLSQAPDWAPNRTRSFTMADLIRKATS